MPGTIEIEVEDDGNLNTNSNFDLATTVVILEKVKTELVQRAQVKRQEPEGQDEGDEDEE